MWPEIETVRDEGKRELVMSGGEISERIKERGGTLDEHVYDLHLLHFLEVSKTCLSVLSGRIGDLKNLTSLSLRNNALVSIPDEVSQLVILKMIDLSHNALQSLPCGLSSLTGLATLDVSSNKLEEMPSVESLEKLQEIRMSNNQLKALPEGCWSLPLLSVLLASHNQLGQLCNVTGSVSLKVLDLSDNGLVELPLELSLCSKIKELHLGENKIKDRRLKKLIDQSQTKPTLDYLRKEMGKTTPQQAGAGKGKKKGKKSKDASVAEDTPGRQETNCIRVTNFHSDEAAKFIVSVHESVADVRPHIVCCIVRGINLKKSVNMFKRFLALQTRYHEEMCEKRLVATIATHDLKAVRSPLLYTAQDPKTTKLTPLFKAQEFTALNLMKQLRKEADEYRKEKKRNNLSGIHKYLDMLQGKSRYPFVLDASGTVISFPPITNCELSKITAETTDLLIEVTSSKTTAICKSIMDALLYDILLLDMASSCEEDSGTTGPLSLIVEQVRTEESDGTMKSVYPSKVDLANVPPSCAVIF